jgi:hypothetical protein
VSFDDWPHPIDNVPSTLFIHDWKIDIRPQQRLGRRPVQPELIADLEAEHYFESVLGQVLSHS